MALGPPIDNEAVAAMADSSFERQSPMTGEVVTTAAAAREAQDHAAEIANDTKYGLTGSVFTRDVGRDLEIAKRMATGIAHGNGPAVGDEARMPFGGTGASGYGRFGGPSAIDEFTGLRRITIEDPDRHYPT